MHARKRRKQKHPRRSAVLLVLVAVVLLSLAAVTTARYVLQWKSNINQVDAANFYFTSDHLSADDVPVYQLGDFKPGESEITFTLQNFVDEERCSEKEIQYTVAAHSTKGDVITKNGSIGVDTKTATVNLTVSEDYFVNGKATVTVTAESTAPYSETLSAVFVLYQHITTVSHTVYDSADSNRLMLYVTTGDQAGTVTITAPANVIFDRIDKRLENISGNTCTFNANANAEYSFAFFKQDPQKTYATSDFKVN